MRIYRNITELIGGTPLLELTNYERKNGLNAAILAKLAVTPEDVELFVRENVKKERAALSVIEPANEQRG